ncbi:MAG: Hsp20/alpha crystallin family protein [Deltaproteobacteria bacterium]|nr:Hsp20/alpha crystallin family protein [Deltaproteobacteria bacterium]
MANYLINPWLEIQSMKEEIGRIMENALGSGRQSREKVAYFQPAADVYETTDTLVIQLEMPGMERESITLETKGQTLWVYGERRMEKDASGSDYHLLERSYGPFARKFVLPETADLQGIEANLERGILTVTVSKVGHSPVAVRRIQINEG